MLRHPFVKFVSDLSVKAFKANNKGRRYATYDKNFALSLFYASPKAYRFCSKLFCLRPSVTMLRLWLRRLHVKPGFCDNVFDMLKQNSVGIADADCVCVLVLDEMSLKRGLQYDKNTDEVVGFEDFGGYERSDQYATHALVLMACGIQSRWKQPLAYFLAHNTTPAAKLKDIVLETIVKMGSVGFAVVCIICDQGATNQQMFRLFGIISEKPYIEINDSHT